MKISEKWKADLDNITLLGIGIIVIWLAIFGYYFIISRQQGELLDEVEDLQEKLNSQERVQE